MMKKMISITMALVMILSLSACNGNASGADTVPPATEAPDSASEVSDNTSEVSDSASEALNNTSDSSNEASDQQSAEITTKGRPL